MQRKDRQAHEGSGIGLALTKELTDLIGGDIQLDSQEGKGSTFTVFLPAQAISKEEINIDDHPSPAAVEHNPYLTDLFHFLGWHPRFGAIVAKRLWEIFSKPRSGDRFQRLELCKNEERLSTDR